jgi:hypothetical protein
MGLKNRTGKGLLFAVCAQNFSGTFKEEGVKISQKFHIKGF